MNDLRSVSSKLTISLRWIARLSSLAINSVFLLILILAITNEDKPQAAAIPLLVLLALTMAGSFLAWRWERAGGVAVVLGGIGLASIAYVSASRFALDAGFLAALVYGAPFLLVGILFWVSGHTAASKDQA